jgi:hypothetical protein
MSVISISYVCGSRSDSVSDCTVGEALRQASDQAVHCKRLGEETDRVSL